MPNLLGTNLASLIVPFTTSDTYPTHDSTYGLGGWREVADIPTRNAIPAQRLRNGMVVYVQSVSQAFLYTGTGWVPYMATNGVNAQTGTSYTFQDNGSASDNGALVTFNNAGAVAVTLPQASIGGFYRNGWFVRTTNFGAGTVTITPTTSTINGAAFIALTTGQSAFIFSDGTNYKAILISTGGGGGGTPAAPTNSVQFNNAGAFGGSANFEWSGTTVKVTGSTSTSGPDLIDLYAFGASGAAIGMAAQQYGDAQGIGLSFTDAAGDNVTVFPYGVQGNNSAFTSSFSIQPGGTAQFSSMGVSVSGDSFGNDILDLATHGVGSPAVSVDQYGEIKQGGGTPLTINYSANHDPVFLNQFVYVNNDVGAAASLAAYGHTIDLYYKGHAGSPAFAALFGASITATTDPTTTDSIDALYGATIFAYPEGSGGVSNIIGINVQAGQSANGAVALCEPLQVRSAFSTSTATVGAINFVHVYGLGGTGGTVAGAPPVNGILIDDQGAPPAPTGSVTCGLHINSQTGAGNFAIKVDGGKSYFGGNIQIAAELLDTLASPGTSGQVLTSTGTGVQWMASGGGPQEETVRYSAGTVNTGTLGGPYTINFSTAFADNNYTAEISTELGEALSTAGVKVAGFTKQAAGVGVIVWVENNDSINHTITVHVFARHD